MNPTNPTRRALLIGIDDYTQKPLYGCVQDVIDMKELLEHHCGFAAANISVLVAARKGDTSRGNEMRPTRENILNAIENIAKNATAGDFIYVHYSGHGSRLRSSVDPRIPYVESLYVLDDGNIEDVEFGNKLDDLSDRGFIVLAGIDCCFSGGITRDDKGGQEKEAIRYFEPSTSRSNDTSRNANLAYDYLYRPRKYTLIAACQPFETAKEYTDENSVKHGRMTYFLQKALTQQNTLGASLTYGLLQGTLQEKCRRPRPNEEEQVPMIIGDLERVVFGTSDTQGAQKVYAHIRGLTNNGVQINRGKAHGVDNGDRWRVYNGGILFPNGNESQSHVMTIYKVNDLDSWAKPEQSGSIPIEICVGSLAILQEKKQRVAVNVFPIIKDDDWVDFDEMEREWEIFTANLPEFKIKICKQFEPANDVDFHIAIYHQRLICILDKGGKMVPYVPPLQATDPNSYQKVWSLIQHLHSYNRISNLTAPSNLSTSKHEFAITKDESEINTWNFKFKSHNPYTIYITILNLTPAYGITQTFPLQNAPSFAVEEGDEVIFQITMHIADLLLPLCSRHDFSTRDFFKLLITREQTSFSHYLLPDLLTSVPAPGRNATLKVPTLSWFVEDGQIDMDRCAISHAMEQMGFP
ncbi:hypothetical protein ETB97_004922 [Aspergillus alliaceus]|uniref:Peptidase C14 caspase domain-containing protein n=1 Tax=Petromyces alliaceus TaxID=209559 RepID=A0A8H5ZW82_PETAA|nr:hypothetical protein ETB97_004922 [Aspergillus burnettii]